MGFVNLIFYIMKLETLKGFEKQKLNDSEMGVLVAGACTDNVATGSTGAGSGDNEAHHYDDDGNYTGMTRTTRLDLQRN